MICGPGAGTVNVALALLIGESPPPALALVGTLATGFLGHGLSIVLHLLAVRHVGAARQAACFATAPFVGAVLQFRSWVSGSVRWSSARAG